VSSIFRFEIESCAGFSSANASFNDHSFAMSELIEVKLRWFGDNIDRDQAGPGTGGQQQEGPIGRSTSVFAGTSSRSANSPLLLPPDDSAGRLNLGMKVRAQCRTALTPNNFPVSADVIFIEGLTG
jgi:hypothetical protein